MLSEATVSLNTLVRRMSSYASHLFYTDEAPRVHFFDWWRQYKWRCDPRVNKYTALSQSL
jgi:hypothetical protein